MLNYDSLLVNMLLEFMYNTYSRYERDLDVVRERVALYGLTADNVHDLLVCQTRLETVSSEFRKIRVIISTYGK